MKTALITWGIVIIACIIEACFCTDLDQESKEFLKKRENERKNNNLHK
tara:strand:+ start:121 stop:264 length:144 start_codon:yes stop_codon:yes gene_type:complete